MKYSYKFKFYLNAKHSVKFGEIQSSIHPHTWEIVLYVNVNSRQILNFTNIENDIEEYINIYEGKYLNELEYFKDVQPTMENIAHKVWNDIEGHIVNVMRLEKIEVSENPTRTYIIEKS